MKLAAMLSCYLCWGLAINVSGAGEPDDKPAGVKFTKPPAKAPTAEQLEAKKRAKEAAKKSADANTHPEAKSPATAKPSKPAATKPAGAPAASKSESPIEETIFDYKVVDGRALKAYVYKPAGDAIRPAVIVLHPGGLMQGQAQRGQGGEKPSQGKARFYDRGFALISLEYRLAPEAKLAEIVSDVEDGYRWVHEKGPELCRIDRNQIGVMGTSAGGYLTLLCGYRVTPRPKFLISISGYGDITADWYAKPDPLYRQKPLVTEQQAFRPNGAADLYLYCRQNGLWPQVVSGHDPLAEKDWFKPYCPALNVTSEFPPTVLVHGDADTDVPYQQSEQMDRELTAQGVRHLYILNRGAGHGLMAMNPGNGLEFNKQYDRLIDFAVEHLR